MTMNNIFDFMLPPAPTPRLYEDRDATPPPQRVDTGGNYHQCYTCGMDLTRLNEEFIVRKLYEYEVLKDRKVQQINFYTMSFCGRCAHTWKIRP